MDQLHQKLVESLYPHLDFCSLICLSDLSVEDRMHLGNKNKSNLFCILLDFHYLCQRNGRDISIITSPVAKSEHVQSIRTVKSVS